MGYAILLVAGLMFLCPSLSPAATEEAHKSGDQSDSSGRFPAVSAQTPIDDEGISFKFGVEATFMQRVKPIRFGMLDSVTAFRGTILKAVAPTPSVTVGYRLQDGRCPKS